jgi:Tol biopolymer transport system component
MTRVMVSPLISMCVGLLLLACSVRAQEVVFSRRVYAKAGQTYQQLWIWSASDGSLTPLTDSPRDHSTPVCSRDGQEVFYVSNSLTLGSSVWRVDRGTGVEQQVRRIANIKFADADRNWPERRTADPGRADH